MDVRGQCKLESSCGNAVRRCAGVVDPLGIAPCGAGTSPAAIDETYYSVFGAPSYYLKWFLMCVWSSKSVSVDVALYLGLLARMVDGRSICNLSPFSRGLDDACVWGCLWSCCIWRRSVNQGCSVVVKMRTRYWASSRVEGRRH